MRKQLILVVDDEPASVRLVRARLQADDYAVITASNGEEALKLVEDERPELVVLDVMMPGMDGFEVLQELRTTSRIPVIMLTARVSDATKLRRLHAGVDDYITKPFNPDALSARVATVLRRAAAAAPVPAAMVLRYQNGIEIDLGCRRVTVDGQEIRLSQTEWELLSLLVANAGRVMLHGELLSRIWGPEFRDEVHYLRTWVSRLRAKLEPEGESGALITTFTGIGYRLEPPPDETG